MNKTDSNTHWLKDEGGLFTGRANEDLETASETHIMAGFDDTAIKQDQGGHIFGRAEGKTKARFRL